MLPTDAVLTNQQMCQVKEKIKKVKDVKKVEGNGEVAVEVYLAR